MGCSRPLSLCTHLLSRVSNRAQPVDVQQPLQLLAQHTQGAVKCLLLLRRVELWGTVTVPNPAATPRGRSLGELCMLSSLSLTAFPSRNALVSAHSSLMLSTTSTAIFLLRNWGTEG